MRLTRGHYRMRRVSFDRMAGWRARARPVAGQRGGKRVPTRKTAAGAAVAAMTIRKNTTRLSFAMAVRLLFIRCKHRVLIPKHYGCGSVLI